MYIFQILQDWILLFFFVTDFGRNIIGHIEKYFSYEVRFHCSNNLLVQVGKSPVCTMTINPQAPWINQDDCSFYGINNILLFSGIFINCYFLFTHGYILNNFHFSVKLSNTWIINSKRIQWMIKAPEAQHLSIFLLRMQAKGVEG